jgi:hypothetical protein
VCASQAHRNGQRHGWWDWRLEPVPGLSVLLTLLHEPVSHLHLRREECVRGLNHAAARLHRCDHRPHPLLAAGVTVSCEGVEGLEGRPHGFLLAAPELHARLGQRGRSGRQLRHQVAQLLPATGGAHISAAAGQSCQAVDRSCARLQLPNHGWLAGLRPGRGIGVRAPE